MNARPIQFTSHTRSDPSKMLPPGSRRSKIRPPRKSFVGVSSIGGGANGSRSSDSSDPNEDYEKAWSILSNAIIQIQSKNVSNLSYEQLYRKAYFLVLRKHGARLYDNVSELITNHLIQRRSYVLDILNATSSSSFNNSISEDFMKSIILEWDEHLQSMKFISDVLMYLNRVYVKEYKKLLIYDLGIQLFTDNFIKINNNEIGEKLVDAVIEEITKSRKGQVITSKMYITKIINMFELLIESSSNNQFGENYYLKYFELKFLTSSETFFNFLSEDYVNGMNGTKYLNDISQFIKEEENRISFYLPSSTFPKLINLMNNILIKDKIDKIINLPLEQEGLSFWLQPVLSNIFNDDSNSLFLANDANDVLYNGHYITELKVLYELIGRIDKEHTLLKLRLKEQVAAQGYNLPTLVKEYLTNASDAQSGSSNATTKRHASITTNSSQFAIKWVDIILKFQNQYSYLVKESFSKDLLIEQCISMAMREFINSSVSNQGPRNKKNGVDSNYTNGPEIISIYMDHFIKQLSKSSTPNTRKIVNTTSISDNNSVDQVDEFINKSILFLRFVKDKDAFEAHYANHFAKRFLNSKGSQSKVTSASKSNDDFEDLVISKLSEELGSTAFDKVIKMNKDIKLSHDITSDWKKYSMQRKEENFLDLELKICNVSDWPKSMTKDYKNFTRSENNEIGFIWPSQLRHTIKSFEEFWTTGKKNDNKSLFWCPKFGSMDLRITYPSKTYEINMSTYAGIIMLLFAPQSTDADNNPVLAFEEKRELTYVEIKELTGIPESDLKRQLQSIAVAPRLRLLVKSPMSKDVNDGDIFKLNHKFASPSAKIKVLTVSASTGSSSSSSSRQQDTKAVKTEQDEEKEEVQSVIQEGRKLVVNASIVRIMKSRQTINHNDLIAELVKQLLSRFQPLTLLIKQRIEDLIEKEYLKRDDNDRTIYHYVA